MILLVDFGSTQTGRAVAQSSGPSKSLCVAMQVYRDFERVDGPSSVLFELNGIDTSVKVIGGKFCVPDEMKGLATVRVGFVLGHDLFNFGPIPLERLSIPWDIYFGDKKYARSLGHLKYIKAAAACSIEFREGEPGVGVVYSPCRSRIRTQAK